MYTLGLMNTCVLMGISMRLDISNVFSDHVCNQVSRTV